MMKKNYTKYTVDELLQDEFFVSSITEPTDETDFFWKIQVDEGIVDRKEFATAQQFIRTMNIRKQRMNSQDYQALWKRIETTNHQRPQRKKIPLHILFIAASLALLFIGGFIFLFTQDKENDSLLMIAQAIKPDMELTEVYLVLSDNEHISISEDTIAIEYDSKGDILVNAKKIEQEEMSSKAKEKTLPAIKINQLVVSKGRRSTLTFSDGTTLWVNAGSRVVYPEQFDEKQREIYIDGEAYLKVNSNPDWPFIVKTKNMDVRVLGTSFNITAYEMDDMQMVALVEGKVEISSKKEKIAKLVPNDLFRYEKGVVSIEQTDVSDYISWIEGWYVSHSERLPVILNRLIRYYGKEITYNKDIEHIRCSGKLDLKDDLSKVLFSLSETAPIRYDIQNENFSIHYVEE